jgi:hypothetical protein
MRRSGVYRVRNQITFAMQSSLSGITEFDNWYGQKAGRVAKELISQVCLRFSQNYQLAPGAHQNVPTQTELRTKQRLTKPRMTPFSLERFRIEPVNELTSYNTSLLQTACFKALFY